MKDKSVLIITLAMLMLAFIASSMGNFVAGAITYPSTETNKDSCSEDLRLLEGKYVVPCVDGKLVWEERKYLE